MTHQKSLQWNPDLWQLSANSRNHLPALHSDRLESPKQYGLFVQKSVIIRYFSKQIIKKILQDIL